MPFNPVRVMILIWRKKKHTIPHEGLFLRIFRDPANTRFFLEKNLCGDIRRHVDLDSLHLESTSYVDEDLKNHFSDLVFSVLIKGHEFPAARVYLLFEHKSSPDAMVGMQILRYMALQWKELFDQNKLINGKLPPILPIVVYQGREDWWHARTSFPDMVDIPSDAFMPYIPDFAFAFFNIRGMDEETVRENIILRFYVEIVKYQNDPRIKEIPSRLTRGLTEILDSNTAVEYIRVFFKYLTKASEHLHSEDYRKALSILPEGGEDIMETLADQWIKEGESRGVIIGAQQGKIEATQNLIIENLAERFDVVGPTLTGKIKAIDSLDTLQALFRQTHRVQSIEEFKVLLGKAAED